MRGDAVCLLQEYELRDVLVAVVGVKEVVLPVLLQDKRASRHRLRRIPTDDKVDGVSGCGIEPLDADVAIIYEAMVRIGGAVHCIDVFDAPPHAVIAHDDVGRSASPTNRAVLAIICDQPNTSSRLDKCLVAVGVVSR